MIKATHTPEAPWHIVPADNKRHARLNLIRHLLDSIPYKKVDIDLPKIPKAQPRPKGATESLRAGQPIPSHYGRRQTAPVDTNGECGSARSAMSAFGTKQTSACALQMSAI